MAVRSRSIATTRQSAAARTARGYPPHRTCRRHRRRRREPRVARSLNERARERDGPVRQRHLGRCPSRFPCSERIFRRSLETRTSPPRARRRQTPRGRRAIVSGFPDLKRRNVAREREDRPDGRADGAEAPVTPTNHAAFWRHLGASLQKWAFLDHRRNRAGPRHQSEDRLTVFKLKESFANRVPFGRCRQPADLAKRPHCPARPEADRIHVSRVTDPSDHRFGPSHRSTGQQHDLCSRVEATRGVPVMPGQNQGDLDAQETHGHDSRHRPHDRWRIGGRHAVHLEPGVTACGDPADEGSVVD